MEVPELIAALERPEAYPTPPADVDVLQTHISVLFFAGDRVYKVKKPVALDFLDYSTLERRLHFCQEEVRLNRRLAPDVFLGVAPITRDADGAITVHGDGPTVEHAVEMVRLPADRMMTALLERGEIDNRQLDGIARLLANFHRAADGGPDVAAFGRPDEIVRQVEDVHRAIELFIGEGGVSRTLTDHVLDAARTWLAGHADLLERRVAEGRVREGHGDLHTGNVCLTRDRIVIYDCIEFSRRLRCRDVACELAFLAMDLDLRCCRGFAEHLLRRYAGLTADPELPSVATFYKQHLAMVRGMTASLRAADPDVDAEARERASVEAAGYVHLAAAYTLAPCLVLMCGLPASGKSHAARAIAAPFEAVMLRSDVVRKDLAGVGSFAAAAVDDLESGIYAPAFTRRTYAALLERTITHLGRGRTVVVDATFAAAAQRGPFLDAARDAGVDAVLVEITCREDVIRERLERRGRDAEEPSDADWRVYLHAKERFEPPDEVPTTRRLRIASETPSSDLVGAVLERLVALGASRPAELRSDDAADRPG